MRAARTKKNPGRSCNKGRDINYRDCEDPDVIPYASHKKGASGHDDTKNKGKKGDTAHFRPAEEENQDSQGLPHLITENPPEDDLNITIPSDDSDSNSTASTSSNEAEMSRNVAASLYGLINSTKNLRGVNYEICLRHFLTETPLRNDIIREYRINDSSLRFNNVNDSSLSDECLGDEKSEPISEMGAEQQVRNVYNDFICKRQGEFELTLISTFISLSSSTSIRKENSGLRTRSEPKCQCC